MKWLQRQQETHTMWWIVCISRPIRNVKSSTALQLPHDAYHGHLMWWTRLRHELAHHTHRKCNIGPRDHHCIHERSSFDLVWNTFHFPLHILKFSHPKASIILDSCWTDFRLVCIISCWNAWRPPRCSSFDSWWWYGLLYFSQILLLGSNATLQDRSSQILSRALIWVTSNNSNYLPIWSNWPRRKLSPTNIHPFVWCITNDPLGSNKTLVNEKRVNTVVPCPRQSLEPMQSFLEFAHKVLLPFLYRIF